MYVATINVPGYLPEDDGPAVFETPGEAWAYLASERFRAEEIAYETYVGDGDTTYRDLMGRANLATGSEVDQETATGTVYGPTPGSDSPHDLGLAYTVDVYVPESESDGCGCSNPYCQV